MGYEWKVLDGVLCFGSTNEVGQGDAFQQVALGPAAGARPNSVELLGLEIDHGPMATLLLTMLGGRDVRELSIEARPSVPSGLPDGEVPAQIYHPQLEIRIEQRSTAECFRGSRWEQFVTALKRDSFLKFYTKLGYIGPWEIEEPSLDHLPATIEVLVSPERLFCHEGIPFCRDNSELLVGIHERSAAALEAALVAPEHLPGFALQLKAYRVREARLRARRQQIRTDLVAILRSIQESVLDADRYLEILLWIGSSENKRWPLFLAEQLSGLFADCERDPDCQREFGSIPHDLVEVVRKCVNRRQREKR